LDVPTVGVTEGRKDFILDLAPLVWRHSGEGGQQRTVVRQGAGIVR